MFKRFVQDRMFQSPSEVSDVLSIGERLEAAAAYVSIPFRGF